MPRKNVKKALVLVIPTVLIVSVMVLAYTREAMEPIKYPAIPRIPVTEYSSIEELEMLAEAHIPKPIFLPEKYECKRVYQVGLKIEQGEIPYTLYLLYSDEEVDFGALKDQQDLSEFLGMMGEPGGYKLLLLMQHLDYPPTKEQIETWAQNYVNQEREKGVHAELIQNANTIAVLTRLDKPRYDVACNVIHWCGSNWVFRLSGHIPEITLEDMIKIVESVE